MQQPHTCSLDEMGRTEIADLSLSRKSLIVVVRRMGASSGCLGIGVQFNAGLKVFRYSASRILPYALRALCLIKSSYPIPSLQNGIHQVSVAR